MSIFTQHVWEAQEYRSRFIDFGERILRGSYGKHSWKLKKMIRDLAAETVEDTPEDRYENDVWRQIINRMITCIITIIYEETLMNQLGCTMARITKTFRNEVLPKMFPETHTKLDVEDVRWLVTYFVRDVLQNEGRPYYHRDIDTENGGIKTRTYRLIEDSKEVVGGVEGYYYRVTEHTINIYLHTYEVDDHINFSLQAYITQEAFKRRNFKDAEKSCMDYLHLVQIQRNRIETMKRRVATDMLSVSAKELSDEADNFTNTTKEAMKKGKDISASWKEFEKAVIKPESESAEDYASIKQSTIRIRKLVDSINSSLQQLYVVNQELRRLIDEVTFNRSAKMIRTRTISIEDDIINRIPQIGTTQGIWDLLIPLQRIETPKFISAHMLYLPQREYEEKDIYTVEHFDPKLADEAEEEIAGEMLREQVAGFMKNRYAPGREVPYHKLLSDMNRYGLSELADLLDTCLITFVMFGQSYTSRDGTVTVSARNNEKGDRRSFSLENGSVKFETENLMFSYMEEGKENE